MTRLRKLVGLISLFILSLVSACSGIAPKQTDSPLRISWTLWQGDYTMLVAERMGFFIEHGVQVKPVYYGVGSDSITDLAGGQLDGGIFTMSDTLFATRLVNIKAVMISDQGSQYSIVAAPGITTVDNLRGKRIGLNIHSSSEIFVYDMLKTRRMTAEDVTYVEMSPNEITSHIPADIDAGLVWEPYTTQAIKNGNVVVFQSVNESLRIPRLIVFRQSVLDKNPEKVKAFLQAWNEAVQYRKDHPQESLAMISKATNLSIDDLKLTGDINLFTVEDALESFKSTAGSDYRSIYYIASFTSDFLLREGYLSDFPNLGTLFDPSFIQ